MTNQTDNTTIQLSIIIATYNRADMLRTCLQALFAQTQPVGDFEVVVVVDGSTDDTREMLDSLTHTGRLTVCWQNNLGVGAARNHGVQVARGQFCLFLDDDIIADRELVAMHLKAQREQQGIVGLGHLTMKLPQDADDFARFLGQWWNEHYTRLEEQARPVSFMDCYSGNLSVPRQIFLEVGGFADDLSRSEDVELGYRLHEHGLYFVYTPSAIGHQNYRKGFLEIAADAEKAGVASLELYKRHPPMLPHMELGNFEETSIRARLLRRLLSALNPPARFLRIVGRFFAQPARAREWYRFLYSFYYWRGVRRSIPSRTMWQQLTAGTPILMYHACGAPGERASRYVVPKHRLAWQMRWLHWRRYCVLSMEEFLRCRREFRLPPPRSVVLTFDDGYVDNYTIAYPILRRYRFPATIFLVSEALEKINHWDKVSELANRPLLSLTSLKDMQRNGISYGAHTRTHVALPLISPQAAQAEVAGSFADLRQKLGDAVPVFAYPYGKFDPATQEVIKRAGFIAACTIIPGRNTSKTPLFALRRIEIYGQDSLVQFVLALWLGERLGMRRRRSGYGT